MNAPMVSIASSPSFVEFEAVLDHAAQSDATLRRAFIKRFFDFMLGQRMNVKGDGLVHVVLAEVAGTFVAAYEANVSEPASHGFYYGGVVDWLKHAKLHPSTKAIIDEELAERLSDLRSDNPQLMFNEMFEDSDEVV